jgi:hypothetical protein
MTWNDELSGHLELINARLTHLESLPLLAYERGYLGFAEYPLPAVKSVNSVALKSMVRNEAHHA